MGVPQDLVAAYLGIDPKTLRLHYRAVIDQQKAIKNFAVGKSLFQKATSASHPQAVTAAIFWAKTQMGWKDTTVLEHTGGVASEPVDYDNLDLDEKRELLRLMQKAKAKPDAESEMVAGG